MIGETYGDARAVMVEGEHSCMKLRGASKAESEMVTTAFRGVFETDRELRREVLAMMQSPAR